MHDCLIAFGSNEGNSIEVFEQATKRLSEVAGIQVLAKSKPLLTKPVGGPEGQDAYLNAVIRVQTIFSAQELHRELVRIETGLGRERRQRWGSRKIDLDLLLYDQLQLETEILTLPHPRMSFRRFVLEPASTIASEMVHATSGQTIGQLMLALDQREKIILFVSPPAGFAEHEAMIQRLLPSGWKFEVASDEESLKRYRGIAKLACFVADAPVSASAQSVELDPLLLAAFSFPGPTLRLHRDLEKSKTEIEAAFEAIKPLSDGH